MRISAKIDYACRALVELSLRWPNNVPMQINMIARRQQIPMKFLIQILLNLKQMGYVRSVRGKNGGYLLAMAPQEIKLSGLIENMGGIGYSVPENRQSGNSDRVMDLVWDDIEDAVLNAMAEIDFETICNRKRSRDKAFMFQI